MSNYIFLIPLFPLLGFLFNFIVGVRVLTPRPKRATGGGHGHGHGHTPDPADAPEATPAHAHAPASPAHADDAHGGHGAHHTPSPIIGWVACGAVALSFLVSVAAVWNAHSLPERTVTLATGETKVLPPQTA